MSDQKTLQGIGRVVSSVVDVQQTMIHQFDALTKGIEALKIEHQTGIAALRDDLRRSDDRAQKQCSDMTQMHNKEMERLHQIINSLLTRDIASTAAATVAPAAQFQQQQQHAAMQAAIIMQRQMELAQAQAQNQAMVNMMAANGAAAQQKAQQQQQQQQQQMIAAAVPQVKPQAPPAAVFTVPTPTVAAPTPAAAPSFPPPAVAVEKPKLAPAATIAPPAAAKFSFGAPGSSIFGKKPEVSSTVVIPPVLTKDADEEDADEEYEPEGDFKPVIPLPDLVEVKTGEEEEQVVFNNRSKLYIYATETSEWKERGTGELKVLFNKEAKKWRVVMRRDQVTISEEALPSENGKEEMCYRFQVLKVCANFPIVGSMVIQKMANNDKAYTWFCEDFSEDEPAHVKLSARFANVEIATEFKNLFEKAASESKKTGKTIDSEIKPADKVKKEIKEEVVVPANGFGDKFKPKPGAWECKACYISNKAEDNQCVACQTNKDGSAGEKNIFSKPSILQPAPGTPKVTFGFGASAPAKESVSSSSQFGASLNGSPSTASGSIFGGGTPKASIFGGTASTPNAAPSFSFNTKISATTGTPSFNFKSASPAAAPQGNALFGGSKTENAAPAPFSFAKAADTSSSTPKFTFGKPAVLNAAATPNTSAAEEKKTETPKTVFGSSFNQGGESFASLAAKSGNTSIFSAENTQKAQQELASLKKTSIFGGNKTPNTSTTFKEDETADADETEYEPEGDFKPVIPLPDLVEVRTGEEDEEVVFTARCKLYKFYSELSENKERGVGDLKILKSSDKKYRVVMRREQVHKLCANFRIEKSMQLTPKPNLPQVVTFMCQDYSDDASKADHAIFTAKFKDESITNEFKQAVMDAQATM